MWHTLYIKFLCRFMLAGLSALFLPACFMESAIPLSPVEQASYPPELIDTWVMLHNNNVITTIKKMDSHQLKIIFRNKVSGRKDDRISHGHISQINGKSFFNLKSSRNERYEFYRFEQPCRDLILLYLPNPDLVDKDIKSGRVKGQIKQDFFTFRIIEEDRKDLLHYINSYQGKLFVPFRYMVRQSVAGKLPAQCKLKNSPGVPISTKTVDKYNTERNAVRQHNDHEGTASR